MPSLQKQIFHVKHETLSLYLRIALENIALDLMFDKEVDLYVCIKSIKIKRT